MMLSRQKVVFLIRVFLPKHLIFRNRWSISFFNVNKLLYIKGKENTKFQQNFKIQKSASSFQASFFLYS